MGPNFSAGSGGINGFGGLSTGMPGNINGNGFQQTGNVGGFGNLSNNNLGGFGGMGG